jgi:wobble nucleotide-excising tRNase
MSVNKEQKCNFHNDPTTTKKLNQQKNHHFTCAFQVFSRSTQGMKEKFHII